MVSCAREHEGWMTRHMAGTRRNGEMFLLYHEQPRVWVELRQFLEVLLVFTDQSVLFSLLHSFFISVCSSASTLFLPAGVLSLHCILASSLLVGWKGVSPQYQLVLVVSVVEICFKQIFQEAWLGRIMEQY